MGTQNILIRSLCPLRHFISAEVQFKRLDPQIQTGFNDADPRGRYWRTVPVRKGEKIEGCTIVSPEAYVTKGCTPAVKISQVPEAEDDMR